MHVLVETDQLGDCAWAIALCFNAEMASNASREALNLDRRNQTA
jgi:hypothetical protein